tara:strand:+ start:1159 stop:1515 length:357 start_codon:yes stop_codon:yes gene_type:complete
MNHEDDLFSKIKDAFDSVLAGGPIGDYPKEALPLGTWVRSNDLDRLGVITDAFYGELDKDNQKIILYTVLFFPKARNLTPNYTNKKPQYFLSNEYEYDITAYLMIKPVDLKKFGGLLL